MRRGPVPPVGATPGNTCREAENAPPPFFGVHLLSRALAAWEGGQKVCVSRLCKNVPFPESAASGDEEVRGGGVHSQR